MADAADKYLLRVSWPHKHLTQNARVHWALKAKATSKHRREALFETWAKTRSRGARNTTWRAPALTITFHPPDKRKRDVQNTIGACKALIDGVADALEVDDSAFVIKWPTAFSEPVKGGAVLIEITDAG